MKRYVGILLILCLFATFLGACSFKSDEQKILDRMEAFMDAYNSGDAQGTMACFCRKTRNTYQAAIMMGDSFLGSLTGSNIGFEELFGLSVGVISDGELLQLNDMVVTITGQTTATVTARLTYSSIESQYSQEVTFGLVKEDEDWYILK